MLFPAIVKEYPLRMSLYYDENSETQVSSTTTNLPIESGNVFTSNTNPNVKIVVHPASKIILNNETFKVIYGIKSNNNNNNDKPQTEKKNNTSQSKIEKKLINRGRWSKEEDNKLKELVKTYKEDWAKISSHFPDRNDGQCLQRWSKVLNPKLIKGPWTHEVCLFLINV